MPIMSSLLPRIGPLLHLTRLTSAFAAVANGWFVILWTRASEHEPGVVALNSRPQWLLLLGWAVTAIGLYAYGTSLNDILDVRRDRTLQRDRPLASGELSLDAAVFTLVFTLLAAILGATVLGTGAVVLTLVIAGAILGFNAAAKFVPAIGFVALGLIYAGHMVVPNVQLRFVWPVWLVMTHALVVSGLTHSLAKKVPPLSRRGLGFAIAGWVFWSGLILWIGWQRCGGGGSAMCWWPDWVDPTVAIWPALLVVVFVLLSLRAVHLYGGGPRAAERIKRIGSLWLILYACAWLYGSGHTRAGLIVTALAAVAILTATALGELRGLVGPPIRYRRE